MKGLGVEVRRHGTQREALCVICGSLYQPCCVIAALVRDGQMLGEICPRCLVKGPHEGARRLRQRAQRMAERARKVRQWGGRRELVGVVLGQAAWMKALAEQLPASWGVTPEDLKGPGSQPGERFSCGSPRPSGRDR